MSLPKQIKSVRCWMSKCSARSLTDIGYSITLDSSLRAYRDYHIRNPSVIEGSSDSSVLFNDLNMEHSSCDAINKIRFQQGMDKLRSFKECNSMSVKGKHSAPTSEAFWNHYTTENKQGVENELSNQYHNLDTYGDIQVYGGFFYGCKHMNFYCNDDEIGAVILSLKVESFHGEKYVRILARSSLLSDHIVTSPSLLGINEHYYDPFSWIETLTNVLKLSKPLQLITHHTTCQELMKLERVFVKSNFKIGVLYVKNGQETEEEIFSNTMHSPEFESFLEMLGDRVDLQGFQGYSGGLDTSENCLNGTQSIYTEYHKNDIMFHVPTLMPNTGEDNKFLGKKRHVGNDVLCVVYTDKLDTSFSPLWIKSQFIYSYILVQPMPALSTDTEKRRIYKVSVICRKEVPRFGPELLDCGIFEEGDVFREWLLRKIINGDRACYKAPKFAAVQQRTRSQIMQTILDNEADQEERIVHPQSLTSSASNSLESLAESVSEDSNTDTDDTGCPRLKYYHYSQTNEIGSGDVTFLAGKTYQRRVYGIRSVMCRKSRVFRDMLTDLVLPRDFLSGNNDFDTQLKENNLAKRAMQKAKKHVIYNNSKKGKFTTDCSVQTIPNHDQHVRTTSIKKGGKTYEMSLDCIGRAREFVMNEFEADIFCGVMEYIHDDKCSITLHSLPGLLCAATYYELPELRLSCLNRLDDIITVETVCQMLNNVEEYIFFKDGRELQDKLAQFFMNNLQEIASCADNFTVLTKNRMLFVLSQNWKDQETLKVKILSDWSRHKDINDWQNVAESTTSSCHQMPGVILEEST